MRFRTLFATALLCQGLAAQVPQAFDFQAVARDANGIVLSAQPVSVRLTVHGGSPNGPIAYQELHATTTSALGLFNLAVGGGSIVQGVFSEVAWGAGAHYLQVELDATGGSTYADMGTTQLLSVPYALVAGGVECPTVSLLGDTLKQANGCYLIIPGLSAANGGCRDADEDGFYDQQGCGTLVDCDDDAGTINPFAQEVCDGADNDCDGQVDEDNVCTCPDNDQDGFTTCDGDCDDSNQNIHPAGNEVCDMLDNDCNGEVDESCPGLYGPCDGADADACMNGTMTCDNGVCFCAESGPGNTEVCNGQDDDCDGQVDEDNVCGACTDNDADGFTTCAGDCNDSNPTINPAGVEICDGQDNDCDGQVDESCPLLNQPCDGPDGDACANGTVVCNGAGGCVCNETGPGNTEVCNGQDDDCDGQVDEGNVCNPCPDNDLDGFTTCNGDCNDANPSIRPGAPELCNGVDDDCDAEVDEGGVCP